MELPLCLEDYEPELELTVFDRRKLITGLAEHGPDSIEKFITKQSKDANSGVAKLVKRLRTKLEHQIRQMRERIERKFRSKHEQVTAGFEKISFPGAPELQALEEKYGAAAESKYIDREIDTRLVDILSQDNILDFVINLEDELDETELKKGWWARFRDALRRFVNYLKSLIRRFIQWWRRRFGKKDEKEIPSRIQRSNILLKFPSGSKVWDNIDHNLDNALATSPEFKRAIERSINDEYAKKAPGRRPGRWKKPFDERAYSDEIKQEIHRRIKRVIKREQRKLAQKYKLKKRRLKKQQRLSQDKMHREVRERESEARIKQLEKQKQEELKKLQEEYKKKIQKTVKKELVQELEDIGYVRSEGKNQPKITTRLIDRFAEIVLSDELKKLPSKYSWGSGTSGLPHGVYEKKKLQTASEISRMDIVTSMVNARITHPRQKHIYDSDIVTHKEMRSSISHVVLIFDKSGSMEENNRILAAKKSVLALYKAVKHRNPQNIVDFIAFDSTVHVMDLLSAWRSTPSGFTNTSEALSTANHLIKGSVADRKLIYLITDGLPEAYTDPRTGAPRAGDLEKSLELAVR